MSPRGAADGDCARKSFGAARYRPHSPQTRATPERLPTRPFWPSFPEQALVTWQAFQPWAAPARRAPLAWHRSKAAPVSRAPGPGQSANCWMARWWFPAVCAAPDGQQRQMCLCWCRWQQPAYRPLGRRPAPWSRRQTDHPWPSVQSSIPGAVDARWLLDQNLASVRRALALARNEAMPWRRESYAPGSEAESPDRVAALLRPDLPASHRCAPAW